MTSEPSTTAAPIAASTPWPDTGTQLRDPGRYEIIGEHGRGGLGRVSRARDRDLGRDVAIKELLSRGHASEVRFFREALITARLEHPGIVPVHEAGHWPDGTPFYAMKLVSGHSLRELIAERATIDERLALLHHVIAVADAIAYAHDQNIIHRDLKPGNVIVGEFGETIVIDWGLAKDLTAPADSLTGERIDGGTPDRDALTATGKVLGTPAYMAPEQERGEHVDKRADVFAIGTMLWELCALERVPPQEPRRRHRMLRRAGVDRDFAIIIDKALDPDPDRRYPDAGALALDLKAFKSGARITARSYSLFAALGHWTRRHRALALSALAFGVLVLASVVGLAVLYRSSNRNAEIARSRLIQSYVEQGRRLLLDGEYLRALPYLSEAYSQGDRSTAVRFLLARATRLSNAQLATHRHASVVRGAAFRSDGSVLSVSDDGEAAAWDAATGHVAAALPAQPGGRHPGAVSRDGAFAAIARADGVTLWDGVHGRTIATGQADRVAIDASGTRIAVAIADQVSAWSVATGERLWTASATVAAMQLAWSGDAVVVVGVDAIARRVDGRSVVPLAAPGPIFAMFAGAGGAIAVISEKGVDLWDSGGEHRGRIDPGVIATGVAFSPDASRIAMGGSDGIVRLYDTVSGTMRGELAGHRGTIPNMAFTDDGTRLATAGVDQTVRIWDAVHHHQIANLLGARSQRGPSGIRFDATGKRLVAAMQDGQIRVFATADPDVESSIDVGSRLTRVQFFDGGRQLVTTAEDAIGIWSTATGTQVSRFDTKTASRATISPDGTKLAIVDDELPDSTRDGDAEIRDVASHALLARLHGSGRLVWASFDHASKRVVTGSIDGVVELWDLHGQRLAIFRGHKAKLWMATFSPDDRWIASASADLTARIWDIASGRELGKVDGGAASVAFDATGTRLLTAGADRIARLWDATTFSLLHSFEHSGALMFATISPDAALVAGATNDGAISVWDVATSSLLAQFHHAGVATHAAFSPTGDRLLSVGFDRRAVIWRIELEHRPPEVVAAFVRCRAAYRLVETRLEPATPECGDS